MPVQGSETNPGEFAFAWDGIYNQFATRMVVPSVPSGKVKITRVGCWLAGYLSATTHKLAIWQADTLNLLTQSDGFTPTVRAFNNGNSDFYDKSVSNIIVDADDRVWVGYAYNPNGSTQFDVTDNTGGAYAAITHYREMSATWPSKLDSPNLNSSWRLAVSFTYEEVILDPDTGIYRSANWNTQPEYYVRRSSAWSKIDDELYVRRNNAWVKP